MKRSDQIIDILRQRGMLRPRDLKAQGIRPEYLSRLHGQGRVMRGGRGLYYLPETQFTENHSLAEASKRIPQGVICLLSALRFHELGTQNPFEVWVAVDRKARRPQMDYPPVRILRFSGQALTHGVQEHQIEGVVVCVYSPAKTVVDCFKYRNKIGLDVALEALREYRQQRKGTIDELWKYAKLCRVTNVMRPYLEATT